MTSAPTSTVLYATASHEAPIRPSRTRRAALVGTGFLACALPTVFTVNITRMLLTGEHSDHRFHQATGQGLILFALWLTPLIGLLRAGWGGRRPSTALGWQHMAFVGTGVVTASIAPGGGAPFLVGVIALTGVLVWLALPKRPRLRAGLQLDPVLAPAALLGCAVLLPYVFDQLAAQNAVTGGHHAQNPHLFDQAWMSACLIMLGGVAALVPVSRHLIAWLAAGSLALGMAGLCFGEGAAWSLLVLGLGVLVTGATVLSGPRRFALARR